MKAIKKLLSSQDKNEQREAVSEIKGCNKKNYEVEKKGPAINNTSS